MNDYDNTNRGAIFKNTERNKETQPHYKGTINFEGQDIDVSLWIREASGQGKLEAGTKFFSVACERPWKERQDNQSPAPKPAQQQAPSMPDDDIPFN